MKIAISGKMKSGKSTLACRLEQTLTSSTRSRSHIYSFADPIRNALKELGIDKENHPLLYRTGAQYLGTDLCRAYDPDWLVKQMNDRITWLWPNQSIIIDDMRFQNEYDWCKANGFMLVRLDISEQMRYNRDAERGTFDHLSETGLDHIVEWDVWCSENTTVQERVSAVLQKYSQLDRISQSGSTQQID